MEFSLGNTSTAVDSGAYRCIVLNEAAQHLIRESVLLVDSEIAQLRKESESNVVQLDPTYTKPSCNVVSRPFLRHPQHNCPPINLDARARFRQKDTNISDDLNMTTQKVVQSESIKFLLALVDCYRNSRQHSLRNKIDRITELLSQQSRSLVDRQITFKQLTAMQKELERTKFILPAALPKQIINCVGSLSRKIKETAVWVNQFELLRSTSSADATGSKISISEWIFLLNDAHNVLTDNDWEYISNHVLKTVKSATFCKLYWIHRLRPCLARGAWTKIEIKELTEAVAIFGFHGKWKEISDHLGNGRTAFSCFKAWHKYLNQMHPSITSWTAEEDKLLQVIVSDELLRRRGALSLIDWSVVSSRLQSRSDTDCEQRYNNLMASSAPCTPDFTPEDDLALLMSIQRLGTGGGRYGCGYAGENPGNNGTWSVIASELPGLRRSARECEVRHAELCERFQPWTFAETRRLFEFCTRFYENTCRDPSLLVAVNIMSYFPGRPLSALFDRQKECHKLASMLQRFWKYGTINRRDTNDDNSDGYTPIETQEVRKQIFNPHEVFGPWVKQLSALGVPDPEEFAFTKLTAWKPRCQAQIGSRDARISMNREKNNNFVQLLRDLEEGQLMPCDVDGGAQDTHCQTQTTASEPGFIDPQNPKVIPIRGFVRLVKASRIKTLLFPLLTIEIPRQAKYHVGGADIKRAAGKRKIRPPSQLLVESQRPPHNGCKSNLNFRTEALQEEAIQKLLGSETTFWEMFDRSLKHNDSLNMAYDANNARALQLMVPELASDMLYLMQEEMLHLPIEKTLTAKESEPRSGAGSKKKRPRQGRIVDALNVPHEKLKRLTRIRNLLQHRRNPLGPRKQCNSPWSHVIGGMNVGKEIQEIYPFTSRLPDSIVRCIQLSPHDFMARVTDPSNDLAAHHFGLSYQPGNNTQQPMIFIGAENAPVQLLPPNYATIVGLRALLLRLPELHSRAGDSMSRVLHARKQCNFFSRPSPSSVVIPAKEQIEALVKSRLDVAAFLANSRHRLFVIRCLATFLWPCLLSNLPASNIVQHAAYILKDQLSKLRVVSRTLRGPDTPLSLKRKAEEKTAASSFARAPPRKRSKSNSRVGPSNTTQSTREDIWVIVNVELTETAETLACRLPSCVDDLIRVGYLPVQFSSFSTTKTSS